MKMAAEQTKVSSVLLVMASIIYHYSDCHMQHQQQGMNTASKLAATFSQASTPQQIHLALGAVPNDIVIMWSTKVNENCYVEYGDNPNTVSKVLALTVEMKENSEMAAKFVHKAALLGLKPGAQYTYRIVCGNPGTKSDVYTFEVPHNDPHKQHSFLVLADMGLLTKSLPFLIHEVINGKYEVVFHIGDLAYNLEYEKGHRGDLYMNKIQDFAARVPYMTTPGDHEKEGKTNPFYHYRHRFSMPNVSWPMEEENLWYSIDIGYTHFISINTELFSSPSHLNRMQLAWLRKDLAHANENRAAHPWIIVMGHKPMYCTKSVMTQECDQEHSLMREQLEDLFFEEGVDLFISGHKHCYERTWPVYLGKVFQLHTINPQAPIYIINGAMGYEYLVDDQLSRPYWLAFASSNKKKELYSRLVVKNQTHLIWSVHTASNNEEVDYMLIIQTKHESFGPVGAAAFAKIKSSGDMSNKIPREPFTIVDEPSRNAYRRLLLYLVVFMLSFITFVFLCNPRMRKILRSFI